MGTINEITDSDYFVSLFVRIIKTLILGTVFVLILSNLYSINIYITLLTVNIEFPLLNIITYVTANNIFIPFIILIPPLNIIKEDKLISTPFTN